MNTQWDQSKLQQYIDDATEESLTLEYKAAASLSRADRPKTEITKDVSSMANSAGGVIIYGLKEFSDDDKKHLPEKIDPINRRDFSKEWLEQNINNIRPHIDGIIITPVSLNTGANDVAYVVEIPQSTTAHQATDHRYYKRFNFLAQAMEDYEIRDIMNRALRPDATAIFSYETSDAQSHRHQYRLKVGIQNLGEMMINYFQLEFTFPNTVGFLRNMISHHSHIDLASVSGGDYLITYRSRIPLFPKELRNLTNELIWDYEVTAGNNLALDVLEENSRPAKVEWTLYADNMKPKRGIVLFSELNEF
jgi:hypothetical protein